MLSQVCNYAHAVFFCVMLGPDWVVTVGKFSDDVVGALMTSPGIEYIAEDGMVSAFVVQ